MYWKSYFTCRFVYDSIYFLFSFTFQIHRSLSSNSITFIPETIGNLVSIILLCVYLLLGFHFFYKWFFRGLSLNSLSSLPLSMNNLINVEHLFELYFFLQLLFFFRTMNDNFFPTFPKVIHNMPKITDLYWFHHK